MDLSSFKSLAEVNVDAEFVQNRREKGGQVSFNKLENSVEVSFSSSLLKPSKKTSFTIEQIKELAESVGIEWVEGLESHLVQFYASDERPMFTYKDIVMQNYDFDAFSRNPAMFFNHNYYYQPPIGRHFSWGVKKFDSEEYTGPALVLSGLFPPEGISEDADHIRRLVKAGFLTACSTTILSRRVMMVEDESEREKLGINKYSVILDQNELVENSIVPIGEHPAAAIKKFSRDSGVLPTDVNFIRNQMKQITPEDQWGDLEQQIIFAAQTVWPDIDFNSSAPDEPVEDEPSVVQVSAEWFEANREAQDAIRETLNHLTAKMNSVFSQIEDLRLELDNDDLDSLDDISDENDEDEIDTYFDDFSRSLNTFLDNLE